MDKIAGGVGLRRGRTSEDSLNAGDALDFGEFYTRTKKKEGYYYLLK